MRDPQARPLPWNVPSTDRPRPNPERAAQHAVAQKAADFVNLAESVINDGKITPDEFDQLKRFVVNTEVIPHLSPAEISDAQADGSYDRAQLTPDEEASARHTLKRAAAIIAGLAVQDGGMDPAQARQHLRDALELDLDGQDDGDVIAQLAKLAGSDKHHQLTPGLRDDAAENEQVSRYIQRTYGPPSDDDGLGEFDRLIAQVKSNVRANADEEDAAAAAQDEDKAVARMMRKMRKRGGAPVGVRGNISTIDQSK